MPKSKPSEMSTEEIVREIEGVLPKKGSRTKNTGTEITRYGRINDKKQKERSVIFEKNSRKKSISIRLEVEILNDLEAYIENTGETITGFVSDAIRERLRGAQETKPEVLSQVAQKRTARERGSYKSAAERNDPLQASNAEVNRERKHMGARVRGDLIKAVNQAAAGHGITQTEWVEKALEASLRNDLDHDS